MMCVLDQRQSGTVHKLRGNKLGAYVSVDIAVFFNVPSREGYKYVVGFMSWSLQTVPGKDLGYPSTNMGVQSQLSKPKSELRKDLRTKFS